MVEIDRFTLKALAEDEKPCQYCGRADGAHALTLRTDGTPSMCSGGDVRALAKRVLELEAANGALVRVLHRLRAVVHGGSALEEKC